MAWLNAAMRLPSSRMTARRKAGSSPPMCSTSSRPSLSASTLVHARTFAVRGRSANTPISPISAPVDNCPS